MWAETIPDKKRVIPFNSSLGVQPNGEDNLLPFQIDSAFNGSVTASKALDITVKYLVGKSFGAHDKVKVNQSQTLKEFTRLVLREFKKYGGCFVHVNYKLAPDLKIKTVSIIPYRDCRIGKKDDRKYHGKILVGDWAAPQTNKIDAFDVFNPSLVLEQTKSVTWEKYKGQILFIKSNEDYNYPIPDIELVLNDAKTEFKSSEYALKGLENGRFGSTVFLTEELIDSELDPENDAVEFKRQKKGKASFIEALKQTKGAGKVGSVTVVEVKNREGVDDVSKLFKTINIDSNINDKLFEYTDRKCETNILKAFGVPPMLFRDHAGLFASSGEAFKQAKLYLQEQLEDERQLVLEKLEELFSMMKGELKIEFTPLVTND